eukprot:GAHX01000533.1.p1 GENE.GAHX01000533.1~~GAHX01000533.1.p1  ORF type:complete len:201 (+),score=21.36 GAHX01000533.1:59-661(+)
MEKNKITRLWNIIVYLAVSISIIVFLGIFGFKKGETPLAFVKDMVDGKTDSTDVLSIALLILLLVTIFVLLIELLTICTDFPISAVFGVIYHMFIFTIALILLIVYLLYLNKPAAKRTENLKDLDNWLRQYSSRKFVTKLEEKFKPGLAELDTFLTSHKAAYITGLCIIMFSALTSVFSNFVWLLRRNKKGNELETNLIV